ncbi:branched-chain amino acid ABC transporter permease [Variovorax sp. VNK109]|uniref:branched-chain amino acid ABC transporter permease n=1 Tax=unclassified Variovorax TaxID=663243 RepID=UPI0013DEC213|nr:MULTISPECIES: branched-chain amino acid ABC transporter permease [unclassified Variovorax]
MESFTIQLTNGLLVGTTIALTALGLSLVFGILHIVNLAHGEFYMTGAYLCWAFNAWLGNFWLAVPLATVCTALLGSAVLMMFFRRMLGSGPLRWALLTLGFGYVLREVAQHVFGIDFKLVDLPVEGTLPFLGGAYRFLVMCLGLSLILGLYLFLAYSRQGLLIRAVASNEEAATVVGVSTARVYFLVCLVSAGLAGAAGAFMLPVTSAYPTMGLEILIMAFVVVVVGGMGNVRGTLLASLLAGVMQAMLSLALRPSVASLITLVTLIVIVVVRRAGASR